MLAVWGAMGTLAMPVVAAAKAPPVLLSAGAEAVIRQPGQTSSQAAEQVEVMTIVAHRQPRQVSEVAGTVTVMDAERIAQGLALNSRDLMRYEPGLDVSATSTRFGFGGFEIRGIGGNRTAFLVDNVPVADQFGVGNLANSGRGLLDLGLVERLEILRGPASTMYGSKALGGVVAVSLLDPEDLLVGGDYGARFTLGGATADDRIQVTAASAWRQGDQSWLLAAGGQWGSETHVAKAPDTPPRDLQDREQQALLARYARETDYGRWRITLDGMQEERDSLMRSLLGHGRYITSTRMSGTDDREQWRFLTDFELTPVGLVERGQLRLWWQESDTNQQTDEDRLAQEPAINVLRQFEFNQETLGFGLDFESAVQQGNVSHRLGYGLELTSSKLSNYRDALETNLMTGDTNRQVLNEDFPLRDFPRTRVNELGVYVHDEIELWSGGLRLSPGIRYEYYDLSTRQDTLFERSFPDTKTTDLTERAWLPRLGVLLPLTANMELFAQYARGFRAPPFEDVNIGLYYPQLGVQAMANPDLKAERGRTVEFGGRWRQAGTQLELVGYRNDYRDFIATRAPQGFDPERQLLIFQSVNRDRVRVAGIELRLDHDFSRQWSFSTGLEYSRGEDLATGQNLSTVTPARVTVSLDWEPVTNWQVRFIGQASRGQRELYDAEGTALFAPPGYGTVDILARYFPRPDLQLGFGVTNLLNRQYWRASGVAGVEADDPSLPWLAEAQRQGVVNMVWHF